MSQKGEGADKAIRTYLLSVPLIFSDQHTEEALLREAESAKKILKKKPSVAFNHEKVRCDPHQKNDGSWHITFIGTESTALMMANAYAERTVAGLDGAVIKPTIVQHGRHIRTQPMGFSLKPPT